MFAQVYDMLMADIDYNLLYQFVKPYIKKDDFVIDAGCGTGNLLIELLKNEHNVIGIDIDSNMLAVAKEKLIQHQLPTPLYEHDLRNPLNTSCDLVISFFDVLCYFKGVKTVMKHIHHALNDQGKFIFDVYDQEVMHTYDGYHEHENDPIVYDWSISFKPPIIKHYIHTEQTTFLTKQYIYPLSYYTNLLYLVGFKNVETIKGPDIRKHYIIAYK